ncbi:MAG TPA: hypothetical protein VHP36_08555 [Chitinispirillaceae bacterium]|nr:hypothetical protein [Chitinispirillaceae bacterium]
MNFPLRIDRNEEYVLPMNFLKKRFAAVVPTRVSVVRSRTAAQPGSFSTHQTEIWNAWYQNSLPRST